MKSEPADTMAEEIDRIKKYLTLKGFEYMESDEPRKQKLRNTQALKEELEALKEQYDGSEDVMKELPKLAEHFDLRNNRYDDAPLHTRASRVDVFKEIRKRIMNYRGELMGVSVETRKKWEEKYDQDN